MALWHTPWAISSDKMYLDDVTKQDMVTKYAAPDKWVRLPWVGETERQTPRTTVETSARPKDYMIGGSGFLTKMDMFNEPELFVRMMKVEDKGGKIPNLVSTDGRQLTVLHMQDDDAIYRGNLQAMWCVYGDGNRDLIYVDNVLSPLPPIPGFAL